MGTREKEAVERLARSLDFIQGHLDPDEGPEWENYSENDKSFFRESVLYLLADKGALMAALGISPTTTAMPGS